VLKIALTRELPKKAAEREKKAPEAERPARAADDETVKEPPLTN
jgi:hypothetical protein